MLKIVLFIYCCSQLSQISFLFFFWRGKDWVTLNCARGLFLALCSGSLLVLFERPYEVSDQTTWPHAKSVHLSLCFSPVPKSISYSLLLWVMCLDKTYLSASLAWSFSKMSLRYQIGAYSQPLLNEKCDSTLTHLPIGRLETLNGYYI